MEEELAVGPEEMNPLEVLKANLQQEAQRALHNQDYFVEMTANSEEAKQVALEVREALGEYGRLIFPKSKEIITIDTEQEDMITYTSMGMLEAQNITEVHRRFVAWLNKEAAGRIGLPMVSVPGQEGMINLVPLRSDYDTFRKALVTALVQQFAEEEYNKRRARIATLPSATGN